MNTPEQKDKKTPEFFIFDRIDELEKISLELMEKADITEPTLKNTTTLANDARLLALYVFLAIFLRDAVEIPKHDAKALRDSWIRVLKDAGLSKQMVDSLAKSMTRVCGR